MSFSYHNVTKFHDPSFDLNHRDVMFPGDLVVALRLKMLFSETHHNIFMLHPWLV